MWINMNETSLTILFIGCMISGVLGTVLRQRKLRLMQGTDSGTRAVPAQMEAVQAGTPASKRSTVIVLTFFSVLVLAWGLAFGFIVGLVSNLFYLVFVFPVAIGIYNGKLIADVAEKARVRQPAQVALLCVLAAGAIYGMLHYGRYAGFIVAMSLEISADPSEALDSENLSLAKAFADYLLQEETGQPGFGGYMLYKANEGVSIGRLGRSSSVHLGPALTVLYWLLELGLIFGLTLQGGRRATRASSVCASCGSWLGGERHLGGTATANETSLLGLIGQRDFAGLRALMEPNADLPSLEVYYQGCQVCGGSPSRLVVRKAVQGTKGDIHFSDASQVDLPPAESALLLSHLGASGD
jgi:hypothetical protein